MEIGYNNSLEPTVIALGGFNFPSSMATSSSILIHLNRGSNWRYLPSHEENYMENEKNLISDAFKAFSEEAPKHAEAWMKMVRGLSSASTLDHKTHNIAYLSVLAVLRRINGIPFHVKMAKKAGASRDEVISAILVGLPAAGHVVTEVLPIAIDAYDNE